MSSGFVKHGERIVHAGSFVTFAVGEFESPDGRMITRELVHHPGAVGVVPVDGDEVVLVRQYRPAVDVELLEIPAGKLDDPDESVEEAARRECIEETGFEPGELTSLGRFYNSAGWCNELTHIFLATDLRATDVAPDGVEEEYMTVHRLRLDEIDEMIALGNLCDAKTNYGLLAALRHLGR